MEKFAYRGPAEILHINARKEGGEDDRVLAADVKLRATCDRAILDHFEPALADALYLPGGAVRNLFLGPITFVYEKEHYTFAIVGETMHGCRVKKFTFVPKDIYQVEMTFLVSFEPTGTVMARIAECLQNEIDVALFPETGDLFAAPAGESA